MEILVVPDIHSREFWKQSESYKGPIVFLGDIIDPYPFEWPDGCPDPIETLINVLNFVDSRDNTTLLLGNHCWQYLYEEYDASRKDRANWAKLHELYNDDKDLFKIAHQVDDVLFTHAGVSKGWLAYNKLELPTEHADTFLDEIWKTNPDIFWQMSYERGGWWRDGSPIWRDAREGGLEPNHYHIYGHTWINQPYINNTGACLDIGGACFIVNTITHEIAKYDPTE